jgi:uncharacterized protein YndB with AHSA1/START domain
MNVDNFKPSIVYTIYIASTPEKVWEALTSAAFSRKYFFGNAVEVDLRIGGAYIVRTPDGSLHISGEVVECDPPRKLTVTFNVNWPALIEKLGPTLVTYEIERAGDVVRLTLTEAHDRPIDDDILSGANGSRKCAPDDRLRASRDPYSVALAVGKKADNYCRGKQRAVVMGPGLRRDDNAEVGFLAAGRLTA